MRVATLVIVMMILCPGIAQDKSLNWHTDFDYARQLASEQDKPVLLYFTGSDWCAPCKKLKADFFESEAFAEAASSFVLVLVDMPRNRKLISAEQMRQNTQLLQEYNKRGSFPTLVGLDSEGEMIGQIRGYGRSTGTKGHFAFLKKILKNY